MSQNEKSIIRGLKATDPALTITEEELARSRARSLAVMDTDVTHIAVGGSIERFHARPARRHWARMAGLGLTVAAAAALVGVVVASSMPLVTTEPAPPAASQAAPVQEAPSGPLSDLFASADEVLVLQALPNRDAWSKEYEEILAQSPASSPGGVGAQFPSLGVEPVNVLQVLKGSRRTGQATLDVEAAPDWWRNTNNVAPLTFLAFVGKGPDGEMHLMKEPHALLEIRNLREGTLTDPTTHEEVDAGADLRERISVAPTGDVPLATYKTVSAQTGVIQETRKNPDGTSSGVMNGHVTATEACFTFQTSTEKVYLRWPAGYTAAIKSLPQDAAGNFALEGTARGDRPVVLNDWGVVYGYDGSTWPLLAGSRTNETASCNNESLPVFEVTPFQEGAGASPFALDHEAGAALP
jgi:hypothetical protein